MRWITTWIACCMVACALNTYAQEWERLNFVPPSTALRGVSITDRFVFAVGMAGVIVRSDDFGQTWRNLPSGNQDWRRVRFQSDSSGWICGDYGRVARTNDAGITWTDTLVFSGDARGIWTADGVHVVVVGDRGDIAVTFDGGDSWNTIQTGEHDIYHDLLAVDFINDSVGCAVGGYSMLQPPVILLTGNRGLNWEPIDVPYIGWLAGVKYASDSVIVAVGKFGNVLRSEDGGLTWDSVYSYDHNDASLRDIDFADPLNGCAVANDGGYISTSDGGLTWTERGTDPNALQGLDLSADGVGIAVGEFGISETGDYGTSWSDQVPLPGGDVFAVEFVNDNCGWMLVQHNFVYHTNDGGQTWTYSLAPCEGTAFVLAAVTDSVAVIAYDISEIVRTANAGHTWSHVFPENNVPLTDFSFADKDTGYATGHEGTILATFDGGLNWAVQDSGGSTLESVHAIDGQHVWAVGEDGVVMRDYDNEGWAVHTTFPTQNVFVGIDFADTQSGVIIGNLGTTIYTSDGGVNWRYAESQLRRLTKIEMADRFTGWICGFDGLLRQTLDGGATWSDNTVNYYNDFLDLSLTNGHVWAVGESGAVFHAEYVLSVPDRPESLPNSITLSVFPNPFNSTAVLHFELPREAHTEIVLYNVLGREAMRLADVKFSAGSHQLTVEAGALASGVYFANLRTPDFSTTTKLLLLR